MTRGSVAPRTFTGQVDAGDCMMLSNRSRQERLLRASIGSRKNHGFASLLQRALERYAFKSEVLECYGANFVKAGRSTA